MEFKTDAMALGMSGAGLLKQIFPTLTVKFYIGSFFIVMQNCIYIAGYFIEKGC